MAATREPPPTNFRDYLEESLKADPELRAEYEKLGPRFDAVTALIRVRLAAGLTQTELAHRMGVSQGVISRLESAWHSPRLDTLAAAARALGCTLEVRFKKAAPAQNARPVAKPPSRKAAVPARRVAEPSRPIYLTTRKRHAATSRSKTRKQ